MSSISLPTRRWRWLVVPVVLAAVGAASWYSFGRGQPARGSEAAAAVLAGPVTSTGTVVEVVTPRAGGIDRVCVQPGTVEPFEAADLYAKVSGFLTEQAVDIGSAVNKGDVLARVFVPEYEKQLKIDSADVERAESKVEQFRSAVATAEADLGSAAAAVALARAELGAKASFRSYRQKQRERVRSLQARDAIDAKLVDEQEDQYQSAAGAELSAQEAVNAAKQKEAAARARVEQAKADLKYAGAEVAVAKARLEKSAVLLDYTVIRSPYTGIVTARNFNSGDFIRSADTGGERTPVLAVERTDVMRVVVQVPDRDVPFVTAGDPASVTFDALPGEEFRSASGGPVVVSRSAASEDARTRTMRTEVDVRNPDGRLRHGMYGQVTLTLHPGAATAVRVPSAAVAGKTEGGKAAVRVVRGGKIEVLPVRCGADNGKEIEVLAGLTPAERVVVRANGPAEPGTGVTVVGDPPRSAAP